MDISAREVSEMFMKGEFYYEDSTYRQSTCSNRTILPGDQNAIKTVCFLADMNDFAAFNEVYAKYFVNKPARSCVAVKTLPKNVLCEVEVIAAIG